MIGFLSWRIAPRRAAPIVAGALHPLLVVTAIALGAFVVLMYAISIVKLMGT